MANFFAIGTRSIIYFKFPIKIKRFTATGLERKYSEYSFLSVIILIPKLIFRIDKTINISLDIKNVVPVRACGRNSYESALGRVSNLQMLFPVRHGQVWVFL
jgi:hypothetical protein